MKKEMPMSEFLGRFSYIFEDCEKIIKISSLFSIPMTFYLIKILKNYLEVEKKWKKEKLKRY